MTYGWGKNTTLEDWLFAEGHRFDFFQAVRLLEIIHTADSGEETSHYAQQNGEGFVTPGQGSDPTKEIVRFKSAVKLDFPSSDIAQVKSQKDEQFKKTSPAPAEMTVNFLGLAGGLGALDIPTTELVLQNASHSDAALKDFLDIFNHRLVSLLYRIRKHHRVGLSSVTPGEDQISRYLYSIIGMGTLRLQGRMHVRDRALLYYAGILAQYPRSMSGLKQILADYFQVEVEGQQFVGAWCDLEESQWTVIGASGRNQRLGSDTVVLGTRVWDQHARFEIQLGPLTLSQFENFLPTEWRFAVLCDLIRFYVKDEFDFNIRLILKAEEIPMVELRTFPALAWTSWLGPSGSPTASSNGAGADPYIVITPEALRSDTLAIKSRILYRLPRGKQAELLGMMERTFEKNSVVMLQGDPGVAMYVIRRGKVQLSRHDEQGKETLMGILDEGDSFGERALLRGKPYNETALALTDCEISILTREDLAVVVARTPGLQRTIDAYLTCGEQDDFMHDTRPG
jgi:type VI secretion system protein ImpH